ncbi:putative cell wall proline rich protein [Aspergillus steynii IBT 23096]|uniref:Putative cell wall proline rich protein n=1 Tax=Aspergillus steynii IBT 23096 TaxID=1392250 RepID=A0A2I2FS87_9EURO|nr:putative cell wall proline rich protein [Aspergillus steynii IBT 23096]PLB43479.1 putative cell wall proline rich protein [Aspergillus steynii IBT 23096]
MASISLPLPPQHSSAFSQHFEPLGQPPSGRSRRHPAMSAPLPNPPFVFPARDPDAMPQTADPPSNARHSLPAFSFNPGALQPTQPAVPTPPANRPVGHRRRCSEFVGGEHMVGPAPVETGQKTEEDSTPVPGPAQLPAPGPGFSAVGPGRRRHAHRRSAAVSSVDLTAISNAFGPESLIGSAPCTPADGMRDLGTSDTPHKPISYSANALGRPTPPASPQITINGQPPNPSESETRLDLPAVERPLSEVSRDSESTIQPPSVVRNNDPPAPLTNETSRRASQKPRPRPRTADASLMLDSGGGTGSDGLSRSKRPLSAAGHSRFRKSMSAGILDAALRKNAGMGGDSHWPDNSRISSSDDESSLASVEDHGTSKHSSKAKKRQKKVRSWAGAILTRGKGKRNHSKQDTGPKSAPPPVLTRTNSDLGSGLDVDFDDDSVVVIRTPTNPTAPMSLVNTDEVDAQPSLESSWKPRSFYEQGTQNDALSPIIDLDAALGPFNTPDMRSGRAPETGFSAATKRMYSGGRRGEFVGPEMRYHRRAESAPEMPPVDRSFLNNRLANNSAMENPDVFYEEEEDAFLAATSESDERASSQAVAGDADKQSLESKESSDTLTHQPGDGSTDPQQAGLGIQKHELAGAPDSPVTSTPKEDAKPAEQPTAADPLRNARNPFSAQPRSPVDLIKQEDWLRKVPVPPSPDISPRFLPADHRPATSPMEFTPNIPPLSLQGVSSASNSSFPSPDFPGSSPDFPRSITTSSTTDRNFSNPSYNPSMEFPHASADDVPSLTSSASTTTNTLNRFSATFFQRPRLSTDRSASFSAAVHRRTSQANAPKRSSLASLSKLVAGPHSERSKLSHEEKPPSDEPEKSKKKGRRISRLMHFWRTKDKDRLNENSFQEERPS